MINNIKTLYDEKIKSLVEKYESQESRVITEPKTDELPFDLGNYQPDEWQSNKYVIIKVRIC
ncbi:MAG: hypothetical protein KME40_16140 [Komarekiella atlantica HA4396-MV6]|jgi:hypothetical protein|nr:hypothetical protein [Komarekiella atlantica HA4396-MV6]